MVNYFTIYHGLYKVTGTFFNPAPFAGFLVASMSYVLLIANPKEQSKFTTVLSWIGMIGAVVIFGIMPATQSRAGWIGFIVSGLYFIYQHFSIKEKLNQYYNRHRRWFIGSVTLITLMFFLGSYGLYQFKKDSADGRLLIWKVSSTIWQKKTWVGIGFDSFPAHYAPAMASYFQTGSGSEAEKLLAGNVQWAFNEPLQFAVELGLPGMILFLGIVGLALLIPLKQNISNTEKQWVYTARASLIGIFIFGLFSYPFHSPSIVLLFFFALAVISTHSSTLVASPIPILTGISQSHIVINTLIILLIITFGIFTSKETPKFKQAYWLWDEAKSLYQIKSYEAANKSFEEALPVLQTNGLFMQQYGKSLYMDEKYQEALGVLTQGGHYYKDDFWYIAMGDSHKVLDATEQAEHNYLVASNMVPHKLYPKYLLATLYNETNQKEKATTMAKDILGSDVKVMSTAVEEIRKAMQDILGRPTVQPEKEEQEAQTENLQARRSSAQLTPTLGGPPTTRTRAKEEKNN